MPDRTLSVAYLAAAAVAFVATQVTLVAHFVDGGGLVDFVTDPLETPAGVFFGIDLLAVAVVALLFMVVEGRRIGLPRVWIYVVLTFTVAISVSLPLFLFARQRQLRRVAEAGYSTAAS